MTLGSAYAFDMSYTQESLGSVADVCGPLSNANDSMIKQVLEKAESIPNTDLRTKTVNFVSLLKCYVGCSKIGFELPRIVTDFHENDAYMEWIFPHFTIGFNISTDESQDGWFIVTDKMLGDRMIPYYSPAPLDRIVEFVERFGDD